MHPSNTSYTKTANCFRFPDEELLFLMTTTDESVVEELRSKAVEAVNSIYGNTIFVRGLIEFSNYCKEGCFYCGINRNNREIKRFRLSDEDIISSAEHGFELGFRTFVLQGGEDPRFTDERFAHLIHCIKSSHPDTAITLSIGVRSLETYRTFKEAGADRYLLRHESANESCFNLLHPADQSLKRRVDALRQLKSLGYQTGTGFLVGAPGSSPETHLEDIRLLRELNPEMIGIGPFIPHHNTIFRDVPTGSVELTLRLLAILRIEHPRALIPSTTALNTASNDGRIQGILHGANVLMPNLSPKYARASYNLYDNKKSLGLEAAEHLRQLEAYLGEYGYEIDYSRGDYKGE